MYTLFVSLVLSYHRPVQPAWIEKLDDQVRCNSYGVVISTRLFVHVWNISDCLPFCRVSDSCNGPTIRFQALWNVFSHGRFSDEVEYGQHVGAWYFICFLMFFLPPIALGLLTVHCECYCTCVWVCAKWGWTSARYPGAEEVNTKITAACLGWGDSGFALCRICNAEP